MSHHVFGIRHHGPGSARSLRQALEELQPDAVVIEGPPEGDKVLPWAAREGMEPPVALLVHGSGRGAFYPFAVYSPEWQALQYALQRGIPVRFMDLPAAHDFALGADRDRSVDPLRLLAEAAGYEDSERWWEHMVEARTTGGVFEVITEAMAALRTAPGRREALREAWMRKTLREARRSHERVAVVCGAWHAPVLRDPLPPAREDTALLKGLAKVKVQATWIPWTYGRLAAETGYGAGVESPGYYEHLWQNPHEVATTWMTRVARLLREEGLDASPAEAIEAVRLAEALAALRGRRLPDLDDLTEAAVAGLGRGGKVQLQLIRRRLVVGDRLGSVPPDTPGVPLQQDLQALQRRLRLPAQVEPRQYDLDLRKPFDRERSLLLHRLAVLGIHWGELREREGVRGTFHEDWVLEWDPEFMLRVIEASRWGATVEEAANGCLQDRAARAGTLGALTALLEEGLLADLPEAVRAVMERFEAQAAVAGDVTLLMEALPPLVRALRYSTVRRPDVEALRHAVEGLAVRIMVGLPAATASLDEDAAAEMHRLLDAVHAGLWLVLDEERKAQWLEVLARLARREDRVAGRCTRLLLDAGTWTSEAAGRAMGLALSRAVEPRRAAAWVEGFLTGSGLVLVHDPPLWRVLDEWVVGLPPEVFEETLPLLRRTFATFPAPERRLIGERMVGAPERAAVPEGFDPARAESVLPVLGRLLGPVDG